MLKTVRDACVPTQMALESSMAEQVEDLRRLIAGEAKGREFFSKNHITAGMRQLFDLGLRRLAGHSDQALFELSQAMGGGKTHSMVAFGLIAKDPSLRKYVVPDIAASAEFGEANVVAFTGRNYPDHYLWGEIAAQIGKGDTFRRYWQNGPLAPDENAWMQLLGDEPTLILLDELPPYFDNAQTVSVGAATLAKVATAALSNLFSAALKLPRVCIVVSNLSGTYEGASKDLRKAIRDVEQEAKRQAKPITPVDLAGDEIYQILKKRLFAKPPSDTDIETVVQAFALALHEAEKSKTIAKSTEQIADEIRASYPFHPSIKDLVALFRNNESYRQTRGLMQFVGKAIRSVWAREQNDVYLIGLQHLRLADGEVRDAVRSINDLGNAISHDILSSGGAVAETIDANLGTDAASQVATLLLSSSLSTAVDSVTGLTKQRLLEYLIAPNRSALEFSSAFDELRKECWYLHRKDGDVFYFSNVENLTKRLTTEAERAPQTKIDIEMRRRLEGMFEPKRRNAYQDLKALPQLDDVRLDGGRLLLILSPDTKSPPQDAARYFQTVVEKNNLCILTGDGSDLASLDEKTRNIYAIHKVQTELAPSNPLQIELTEKREAAEQDFNATVTATFNRVYYPMKSGLVPAKLSMTFSGNRLDGEEQIEKALVQPGVAKLVLDLEKEEAMLIQKAEEMLWPPNQKRVPWRDIRSRSISNERWSWLPKDGLDRLRQAAEQKGIWRSSGDGYIEKGPFEKPKTSVNIQERWRDEATETATLDVSALHAGPKARIFHDTKPTVSPRSTELKDSKLVTNATKVHFLAIDPSNEHETGEPKVWTNRLRVEYQPREGAGTRQLELKPIPRGTIRYTLTGTNPVEGQVYEKAFDIPTGEVVVSCYIEDEGVSDKRTFRIPAAGNDVTVDPGKPARLKKRLNTQGTAESYKVIITPLQKTGARAGGVTLEIGSGSTNASLRLGSEVTASGQDLDAMVHALRTVLGDDMAEVQIRVQEIAFQKGQDLSNFVSDHGLKIAANEVEP